MLNTIENIRESDRVFMEAYEKYFGKNGKYNEEDFYDEDDKEEIEKEKKSENQN